MNSDTTPDPRRTPGAVRSGRGGWIFLLLVLLVLGLGWWLLAHDVRTKFIARKASQFKKDQWALIYAGARLTYEHHAEELKKKDHITLRPDEVPAVIRDLGYEEFFATPEGVTYQRSGGGIEIYFTAIHCVLYPQSRAYDRKGVWFLGPQMRDWVYEPPVAVR